MRTFGYGILFLGLGSLSLRAQIDPQLARVRHLLEKVDSEMKEIDRMLLDTSGRAGSSVRRDAKKVQEALGEAKKTQHSASENIQKLLEEMQKLADQQPKDSKPSDEPPQDDEGQGQGQQPKPKDGQPQSGQEPQQRQQQQQGLQTPDMVRQNAEQSGKPEQKPQQGDPKEGGDPVSGKEDPSGGKNRPGGLPPEGGEERIRREAEAERWGMLPKYLEFMHSRGSLPEVPDRYRRLYEAYLKSGQKAPPPGETRK